jgi:ubiquinone/menaquinone biosynthesis C-methylase UbiE
MTILGAEYRGRKASEYDEKRGKQKKWHEENTIVESYLRVASGSVLDVPVGTGRYLGSYARMKRIVGIDTSEEMLALARTKSKKAELAIGDATCLKFIDNEFDTVVCVRLLHLMNEKNMRAALREVCRVAKSTVVLTAQLGAAFRAGHEVATHDERAFRALIKKLGWRVTEEKRITAAGWHVMKLERT